METKTRKEVIHGLNFSFVSDVLDGCLFDTKVSVNGVILCWIQGDAIDDFICEFDVLIDKFKI